MLKQIVFLTDAQAQHWGATVARAEQMAKLVQPALIKYGIATHYSTTTNWHDALIIVHKGFLLNHPPAMLGQLRAAGNVLLGDYVDGKPNPGHIEILDGLLAVSHEQENFYRQNFPGNPVYHLTQLVDLRLPHIEPPTDQLRLAYFGAAFNAQHREALQGFVKFIETPTTDLGWMAALPTYNAHYAVRAPQPNIGFKPFGKGFVAAHCGCPIVVGMHDGDARYYLGDDYPYLVPDDSLAATYAVLQQLIADFGGPRWHAACATMAKVKALSSADFVLQEFMAMAAHYFPSLGAAPQKMA